MINAQKAEALRQKEIAVANEQEAQAQRKIAETEKERANDAAAEALKQKRVAESEQERANIAAAEALTQKNKADAAAADALVQKNKADVAAADALVQKNKADAAAADALVQKNKAEAAQEIAEMEKVRAVAAQEVAEMQKEIADQNARRAEEQRKIADQKTVEALAAKEAEAYEAYVARIGAASAKIEENAYDSARDLLKLCVPADDDSKDYRNWEWGRLWYLCNQQQESFTAAEPLESIAYSPDGGRFVTVGRAGRVFIWNIKSQDKVEVALGDSELLDVAFSPDGTQIAVGGNDRNAFVRILDAASGKTLKILKGTDNNGHTREVASVEFSGDGKRLLTGSYDETAKIWDLATGRVIRTLVGHSWWVWQASFCPNLGPDQEPLPETKIVTVSQDGMAIVWMDESGNWTDNVTRSPSFRGHNGPIYAASFSPDGTLVATGGYDKRVTDLASVGIARV